MRQRLGCQTSFPMANKRTIEALLIGRVDRASATGSGRPGWSERLTQECCCNHITLCEAQCHLFSS